jgi:hypothetical protein
LETVVNNLSQTVQQQAAQIAALQNAFNTHVQSKLCVISATAIYLNLCYISTAIYLHVFTFHAVNVSVSRFMLSGTQKHPTAFHARLSDENHVQLNEGETLR